MGDGNLKIVTPNPIIRLTWIFQRLGRYRKARSGNSEMSCDRLVK